MERAACLVQSVIDKQRLGDCHRTRIMKPPITCPDSILTTNESTVRRWYAAFCPTADIDLQRRFGYKSFYERQWGTQSIEIRSLSGKTNERGQSITRSDVSVTASVTYWFRPTGRLSSVQGFLFVLRYAFSLSTVSLLDQSKSQSITLRRTLSGQSINWLVNLLTKTRTWAVA